jgi:hypothetical protein
VKEEVEVAKVEEPAAQEAAQEEAQVEASA